MSGQNSDINRVVDDTAEGHRKVLLGEAETDRARAIGTAKVRVAQVDDAEAEGHVISRIEDADTEGHGIIKLEDAETEGHKVMRSFEAEELRTREIRTATLDDDEAEGHVIKF